VIDAALIEHLADAAWPAEEQIPLGPWKLRATHGVTRRANSVFTAGGGDASDAQVLKWIDAAETFYVGRALPIVFQISAATGMRRLDALLAARGYGVNGASEVWVRDLDGSAPLASHTDWSVQRCDDPDAGWFDCAFDELADRRRVHEQIVRRAPWPRVFVSTGVDGQRTGCGMATSGRGYTGIFCMATREGFRRRGVGLAMVQDLCAWGAAQGDRGAFLQVMVGNEAAQELYRKAGFAFAYSYHYRVKNAAAISPRC
jgi:ribosomal protein S18 acetylase RimI-like enzyme